MSIHQPLSRRFASWALLMCFALGALTACNKQRANWYLKNAQKRLAAAQQNEAERFKATDYKAISDKVQEAQGQVASGAFDVALTSAQEAAERAKTLLAEVKQNRANTLRDEAQKNVKIATDNQGQQLNEAAYTRINELYNDAEQALAKQKYEKTIQLCLQVAQEVEALLQPLKQDTENKLREAAKLREDLLREGAEVEAPATVTDTDKKIEEMRLLVEQERQYRKAQQVYQDIDTLVKEGITRSLQSRSRKIIAVLEKKLVRAINEEAPIHTPDLLETSQQQYQEILRNYYPPVQDYRKVLDMANLLDPQLDELILRTRILASTAKINAVTDTIRTLEENNVRTYLPGRLEKMEDFLKTAQEQFKQQQYDECKKTCMLALEEGNLIDQAFDELARSEIQAAAGKLDEAASLLDQMGVIFSMQAPQTDDPMEKSFENGKQVLKTGLDSMAADSRLILGGASVQREAAKFDNAIESARLVVAKSNYIIREIYHTVAHNNVLEVANKITQVNLNGGAKYAQTEVEKAKSLLEEARAMIRREEAKAVSARPPATGAAAAAAEPINPDAYRPAVSKTAEAKAAMEVSIQRVAQGVVEKISEATKSIETADANKAGVYALGEISTAKQVIEQASDLLVREDLYEASNKAEQAQKIAHDASVKSLTSWANEAIAAAQTEMNNAKQAGADHYAAERYKKALSQIEAAKAKMDIAAQAGEPERTIRILTESKDLALSAQQEVVAARMEPVTQANREIVKARSYNAWQEEYPLLMQAIIDARNALESMEAGDYNRARTYANKAAATADLAGTRSQSKLYTRRVKSAANDLTEAAFAQGGMFYNIDKVREMMKRLQSVRRGAGKKEFETISAELDQFEADLYQMVEETPALYKSVADAQRALYDDLVKRGAKEFAEKDLMEGERRLRFAQIDFNQGNFRSSYQNLKAAAALLGAIDLQYQERAFATIVKTMFAEFTEKQKIIDPLLKVPTAMMHRLLDKTNKQNPAKALFMGADPVQFHQMMSDLYNRSKLVPYPVTMDTQRSQFVGVFDLARQAGMNFEKFVILDQYDSVTARKIVDTGYDLMGQARKQQQALSAQFEEVGLQGDLAELSWDIGTVH